MKRLKEIEQAIIDSKIVNAGQMECRIVDSRPEPMNETYADGRYALIDVYEAEITIENVSDHRFRLFRLFITEHFRMSKDEEEKFSLNTDPYDDVTNIVEAQLTLVDREFIIPDPEGEIEIDGQRWTLGEPDTESVSFV
ncbi:MAG: hypothetical protein HN580_24925 [Deltaproteobacteria bacterium]|jgi:hypothetical protein|nr:hypothetical protein [Deltaproteobacteria bacterium]MBT7892283.1 hypothetical protein [Deltaproteobacteria bacterium]